MQWLINIIFELCKTYIDGLFDALALMPVGTIVMWSGGFGDVPEGWLNCNGENGTVDMRQLFPLPAGAGLAPHLTGGASTHTHAAIHGHTHEITPGTGLQAGTDRYLITSYPDFPPTIFDSSHMSPWKSLVFIQKMF